MRTKSTVLDRSEKILLKLPAGAAIYREHNHLLLEVCVDIRDRLTLINSALQALNKDIGTWLLKLPKT